MKFILRMAWRDSRASRRRLAFSALSIVLGVAALVAIGSFSANLRQAIDDQARALVGADLVVTANKPFSPALEQYLAGLGGRCAHEVQFASMVRFPAQGDQTRLVQVRALETGFPFYGEFLTTPALAASRFPAGNFAILEESLMAQFGVRAGDPVRLGQATFTAIGAVQRIPGESMAVAMISPRVFIPHRALAGTGLIGPGSLVRYRAYLQLPPGRDPAAVERELRARFRAERLGLETVEHRKRDLGRALTNVYSFLSLVGFVALFLGAIGVASAVHVYIRQKISTVAILRCLGASAWQSFAIYVVQGCGLGLFGTGLGAALGLAVQLLLPVVVRDFLPFDVAFFVSWPAVGRGVGAGLAICLLFTLLPLLDVRKVSPLVALRSAFAEMAPRFDPWRVVLGVAIVASVAGFAVWQTGNVRTGAGFTGMLAVGFGVLGGVARLVAWAARRFLPRRVPYVVRQGVANLYRPNNRTVLLLLALGLGAFLLLTLHLTRATLQAQVEFSGGGDRANLLLFDIQDDQVEPLARTLAAAGAPVQQQAPIVTMKLAKIKGRPVRELLRDRTGGHGPGWALTREYRSTYRGELTPTERLVAGKFDGRVAAGAAVVPVSFEQKLARDLGLALGDEVEFDVQGLPVKTRVTSLREVEWRRLEPNFFVVFPLGALEDAPKFFVVAARAATPAEAARAQQAAVREFPNVSAIDLALVLDTLDRIFTKVAWVVQFMALFTVVTGVLVLAGAVVTGRYQRIRETVLLRTLGATRRQLLQIQLVEYAILGVLAVLVGGVLAVAGNALLAEFVFETAPVLPMGPLVGAMAAMCAVTLATGWLANRGVADHPPLAVLRQET
ncbi:MAG: ABC transporter permease [Opitutae bacterium]|nr:ABC transporter permease [Opitutae bacterium]